jgi:hypothetical protein
MLRPLRGCEPLLGEKVIRSAPRVLHRVISSPFLMPNVRPVIPAVEVIFGDDLFLRLVSGVGSCMRDGREMWEWSVSQRGRGGAPRSGPGRPSLTA